MKKFFYSENLSKTQLSGILNSAKIFAKKHPEMACEELVSEFFDELFYLQKIGDAKFELIDLDDERLFKDVKNVMREYALKAAYQERNKEFLEKRKEFMRMARKKAAMYRAEREKPTSKQVSYYKSLCKKAGIEPETAENLSKADYMRMISGMLDKESERSDEAKIPSSEAFSPRCDDGHAAESGMVAENPRTPDLTRDLHIDSDFKKIRQSLVSEYTKNKIPFRTAIAELDFALEAVADISPKDFILGKIPSAEQIETLKNAVATRLSTGMPMQLVVNTAYFAGSRFYVDENVLVPRPETELCVEKCLEFMYGKKNLKVLDIGTGSGCIAVSLAKMTENARFTAVDISPKALDVARKNAENIGVSLKIDFVLSDVFENVFDKFDIIISNPPYIPFDADNVDKNVSSFEPHTALFAPENGLFFYRTIVGNAEKYLNKGGLVVFEVGIDQSKAVAELFAENDFVKISEIPDLQGIPRVVSAVFKSSE